MSGTNSAILDQLEQSQQAATAKREAELEKAHASYWSILADPARVSAEDKAAMAAAMKTLGKTLEDADADSRIIETLGSLPEAREHIVKLQKLYQAAQAADLEYTSVTCPKIYAEMREGIRQRRAEAKRLENESTSASNAHGDILAKLEKHADTVENIKRFANLTIVPHTPNAWDAATGAPLPEGWSRKRA